MSYHQDIYDQLIAPREREARMAQLPRWRRTLARIGHAYRTWTYNHIESLWAWFLLRLFLPAMVEKNQSARSAYYMSRTRLFKRIEHFGWAPVHYLLHPLALWSTIQARRRAKNRTEYLKWVKAATLDEKMSEWQRRMDRGGPIDGPRVTVNEMRAHGGVHPVIHELVNQLPDWIFGPIVATVPWKGYTNRWQIQLIGQDGQSTGFLTNSEGYVQFEHYVDALSYGDLWLRAHQKQQALIAAERAAYWETQ